MLVGLPPKLTRRGHCRTKATLFIGQALVLAPARIAKNGSEQVPPRHRVAAYLAYSSSRSSIASSRNRIKGVCVSYPHSLNVRSELVGFHLLTLRRAPCRIPAVRTALHQAAEELKRYLKPRGCARTLRPNRRRTSERNIVNRS
jgi:hypothetical protein